MRGEHRSLLWLIDWEAWKLPFHDPSKHLSEINLKGKVYHGSQFGRVQSWGSHSVHQGGDCAGARCSPHDGQEAKREDKTGIPQSPSRANPHQGQSPSDLPTSAQPCSSPQRKQNTLSTTSCWCQTQDHLVVNTLALGAHFRPQLLQKAREEEG